MACEDFQAGLYDEHRFLSLGDENIPDAIEGLQKLVRMVDAIVLLGEKMADQFPRCRSVRNRPVDHFFGEFERMCYEKIKIPLRKAVADLQAIQMSRNPRPGVSFEIAVSLEECGWQLRFLSGEELPEADNTCPCQS